MDEGGPLPSHLTQSWVGENDVDPAADSTNSAAARPARVALDGERVRQLEAGDAEKAPPPSPADGAAPGQPASADIVALPVAARDADWALAERQERDIQLLVSSNKALRRDVVSLQVRTWRHEETIAALQKDLTQTRASRAAAIRRGRQLESLHRGRRPFATKLGGPARKAAAETTRRPLLAGDEPFFSRGFLLGGSSAIVGTAAERIINAPSGIMIFGPYVKLAAGTYAATVEARLYQRLPLWADFKIEVACDGAEQIIAERWVRLFSGARWRRCELVFTVWDGEDYPDFEVRIWARSRTPLAIGRIDLFELTTAAQNGDA